MTEATNLPKWFSETLEKENYFPLLRDFRCKKSAKLHSEVWENEYSTLRLCILQVQGKFFAETVAIFPKFGLNTPIFGSEYLKTPRKTLAAVDFHPQRGEMTLIKKFLGPEALCEVKESRHYDLKTHFSPWLWLKKGDISRYSEFSAVCATRSDKYHRMVSQTGLVSSSHPTEYCQYMSQNDPARGILKAYFGSEFSNDYTGKFLFPDNSDFVRNFYRI